MRLRQALEFARQLKPTTFSDAVLTQWVNEVEGTIQKNVFRTSQADLVQYDADLDLETVLLVDPPHDKLYGYYVAAMIDFGHGEYQNYENTMGMCNACVDEFAKWYVRTFGKGAASELVYLSAYAIAVKHGYTGTESEWAAQYQDAVDAANESAVAAIAAAEACRELAVRIPGLEASAREAAEAAAGSADKAGASADLAGNSARTAGQAAVAAEESADTAALAAQAAKGAAALALAASGAAAADAGSAHADSILAGDARIQAEAYSEASKVYCGAATLAAQQAQLDRGAAYTAKMEAVAAAKDASASKTAAGSSEASVKADADRSQYQAGLSAGSREAAADAADLAAVSEQNAKAFEQAAKAAVESVQGGLAGKLDTAQAAGLVQAVTGTQGGLLTISHRDGTQDIVDTGVSERIKARELGNAALVRFGDGATMQEKVDRGDFNGKDGVSAQVDGFFSMRVDDEGHLLVAVADGAPAPPLRLDADGNLIYTI